MRRRKGTYMKENWDMLLYHSPLHDTYVWGSISTLILKYQRRGMRQRFHFENIRKGSEMNHRKSDMQLHIHIK